MDEKMDVISGSDWSCIFDLQSEKNQNTELKEFLSRQVFNVEEKNESPLNLGLIQYGTNTLRSRKYIGVMPLFNVSNKEDLNMNIIIKSRFSVNPIDWIKKILEGTDYKQNPGMLRFESYTKEDLFRTYKVYDEDCGDGANLKISTDRVVFGYIKKVPLVNLDNFEFGENGKTTDYMAGIMAELNGVFEIFEFVELVEILLKKGLKSSSTRVEENLVGKVKGRIMVNEHIKHNLSRGSVEKVYCCYNKMSNDIIENQIIKYALYLCRNSEIGSALEDRISKLYIGFCDVPFRKCTLKDFSGIKTNGAYKHYKPVIEAAKKIISRFHVSYEQGSETEKSDNKDNNVNVVASKKVVTPFFIDMDLLFEYYCRALVQEALEKTNNKYFLEPYTSKRNAYELFRVDDPNTYIKKVFMRTYFPDIWIRNKDKSVLVLDAKYSNLESQSRDSRRSRTHQVLFYMNALNCSCGGLICPIGSEKIESVDLCINGDPKSGKKLFYIPIYTKNTTGKIVEYKESEEVIDKLKKLIESINHKEKKR